MSATGRSPQARPGRPGEVTYFGRPGAARGLSYGPWVPARRPPVRLAVPCPTWAPPGPPTSQERPGGWGRPRRGRGLRAGAPAIFQPCPPRAREAPGSLPVRAGPETPPLSGSGECLRLRPHPRPAPSALLREPVGRWRRAWGAARGTRGLPPGPAGPPLAARDPCPDSRRAGRIFRNLGGIRGAGSARGGGWTVVEGSGLAPLHAPLGRSETETPSSGWGPFPGRGGGSRQFPAGPRATPGRCLEAPPPPCAGALEPGARRSP